MRYLLLFFCFFLSESVLWSDDYCELERDLIVVQQINQHLNDRFPVTYNHFLQGGYINMPSARMAWEGDVGFGYAHLPPYRIYSGRVQFFDFLEVTGNYRIFRGVEDPVLSASGFGDFSDKGANLKVSLIHPEDSDFTLPGIALGIDDFLGTRAFKGKYGVVTQVIPTWDMEMSIGYGEDRINGFFWWYGVDSLAVV